MKLEVQARHRQGAFALDAGFTSEGGLTALFGPSGSGKTTLIGILAGLVRPDEGRVALDGMVLLDTERRIDLPAHRRRVGYIFQEGRLFPHLSVRRNLLYGRWFAPRDGEGHGLDEVVELLGIGHLLGRRPSRLSGGEKQRVAIGRALLAKPRLLLMDEPLAALDQARKDEILPFIERLRDTTQVPIVYVSHALAEVTRLATQIVVMREGRTVASGPTADLMRRVDLPGFSVRAEAGVVIEVEVTGHDEAHGLTALRAAAGDLLVPRLAVPAGTRLPLQIRARDVMLATERPHGLSALNILEGTVSAVGPAEGSIVDIRVECRGDRLVARLTRRSVDMLGIVPGRPVYAVVKAVAFEPRTLDASASEPASADADAIRDWAGVVSLP
ncbi:molybdenum ABC transporter ATP-binding protein [Marinivivus vitaminiproducens]|uniref:molybdenum ABC transporter ATP-binding protein n=1 Tax=Marinivivus vitaminiproducens TaxID=3035935 RepID=UPI00279B1F21|nr:molybdenum ABC transporter ATP-binding protein [Geminicoccaceae bacterium SCSIO 64248]